MWNRFKDTFIADFNIISHDKKLLAYCLTPVLIFIFLRLLFPLISGVIFQKTGFLPDKYYSLVALSFISIIPMLSGMIYAFNMLKEKDLQSALIEQVTLAEKRNFVYMRLLIPAFFSFFLVLMTIILVRPVPTQGWLRTLFAAWLFSIQTPFVILFICTPRERKISQLALSWLFGIFVIAAPLGLLLHHPWNHLAFFSPFYWIDWAWIVQSPHESMIYGALALILTMGAIFIFLRNFMRKNAL